MKVDGQEVTLSSLRSANDPERKFLQEGKCVGTHAEEFFAERSFRREPDLMLAAIKTAKGICAGCTHQMACLAGELLESDGHVVKHLNPYGIRGGVTERDQLLLARELHREEKSIARRVSASGGS